MESLLRNNLLNVNMQPNYHSWPFKEAAKLLKYLNNQTPRKGFVAFETGYGPSGLPHIGTFAEVLRTVFVMQAFQKISDIPTKLICFSDDFDGLRKIPENLPNKINLQNYIDVPLSRVPDPFEQEESFGAYMNKKLCKFLDQFGFQYEFYSSSDFYKSGKFDDFLLSVLQNHDLIKNLVVPTLGEERSKNYSPFLPLCKKTGKVLQVKIEHINLENSTISYFDHEGELIESKITAGNTKLQWKADFGMRWAALDIDFEIYGKEHLPNAPIYQKICSILNGTPPMQFVYELFLDSDGAKISKSKGNSISLDDLMKYSPLEAISLFIYNSPNKAKKLDWNIIPKTIDDYLAWNKKYFESSDQILKQDNPLYHIHNGNVPKIKSSSMNFTFLLNLISAFNSLDINLIWKFIESKHSSMDKLSAEYFYKLLQYAILYYGNILKLTLPSQIIHTNEQKQILESLFNMLKEIESQDLNAEEIQNKIYDLAMQTHSHNLKAYFRELYILLLSQEKGPRLGSFIKFFGIKNTQNLILRQMKENI